MDNTLYGNPSLHTAPAFPPPHPHHPLVAQDLDLDLDAGDPFHFDPPLDSSSNLHHLHGRGFYDPSLPPSACPPLQLDPPPIPSRHAPGNNGGGAGQFGMLTLHPQQPPDEIRGPRGGVGRLQNSFDPGTASGAHNEPSKGHFSNLKFIPNPPNLEVWRQRLFDLSRPVHMTEEEFNTYFPHVDNVYSHRSTQTYKRKPFVSHYFDCRLKGRPPGTKPSEDPSKQKRKRKARERDLCDVKIKITEYFPDARQILRSELPRTPTTTRLAGGDGVVQDPESAGRSSARSQSFRTLEPIPDEGRPVSPGSDGARFYAMERLNGNGKTGRSDDTEGMHQHTLDESDRIKKSSVNRHFLKEAKESRRSQKSYHTKATGAASATVKRRSKEHDLKLFGSCFCPFVQRVWISLELKGLDYQYIEIDPYHKTEWFLALNPRGLVPALRHGEWTCYESSVLMEYLEDLNTGPALLPPDPKSRAHCRLWSDHINRHVIPGFYRYLQAQDAGEQVKHAQTLLEEIKKVVNVADPTGPFFLGAQISFVDVQIAPWVLRMRRVLAPYRGWPEPDPGSRWARWVEAIEGDERVKATTSGDELYRDSYERYAQNRPDTSQVQRAINEGGGLP